MVPEHVPSWQEGEGETPSSCVIDRVGFVELDPIVDGFSGVLIEIVCEVGDSGEERYLLRETAAGSGNPLLNFETRSKERACVLFEREMDGKSRLLDER